MRAVDDEAPWPLAGRVVFRFGAIYLALYALLNGNVATLPLALVAPHGRVPDWYSRSTNRVVGAVARAFGVHGDVAAFDNGDSVGDHLLLLCFALMAAAGALIWSVLDRRRPHYRKGLDGLHDAVRYVLASTVFAYAVFKVFPAQFSVPGPSRLMQTYGRSSPMGLLWTFMGASPAYQMFTGAIEILGCTLLLFRRTTTLGALVLAVALTNIGVIDLCYDVPAKLCVLHLLLMAGFLLAPGAKRLRDALVLGRAVPAVEARPASAGWRPVLKVAVVALVVYVEAVPVARYYFSERDGAPRPPLYGAYDVVEMRRDGEVVPPMLTDGEYWHRVAIDRRAAAAILFDGSKYDLAPSFDASTGRGSLRHGAATLSAVRTDDGGLKTEGLLNGQSISVRARPTDARNESLVRHRFRWFNDGADTR